MAKNIGVAASAEIEITPLAEELGYGIWDVEYVREGAEQYLRVTICKEDGVIDLNDCEKVHRAILPILDKYEWDHLEVSSPGAEVTLKKPSHFASFWGEKAEIRLFAPDDSGNKVYIGIIKSSNDEEVVLDVNGEEKTFSYSKIGKAKTIYDF